MIPVMTIALSAKGQLPERVSSPTPGSWNQIASWLNQIDDLRQAA